MRNPLRKIPAVETVLQALGKTELPRPIVAALVRRELAELRSAAVVPDLVDIVGRLSGAIADLGRARIQPVINGAGVIVHTNLGRAPLSAEAIRRLQAVAQGYSNLEFELNSGSRGRRAGYLEHALALLCQSEAATVVNNCAAALVLVVRHFARKRSQVLISRGELVQIGGGFRIPEILEASGAQLREVGTTNKTSLEDYAEALGPETGLILRVHRSNFYMGGFVASPAASEIASLARSRRVPFVEDLGSGAVAATQEFGFEHEPTPAEVLKQGPDLVTFSGDKLFGGPQAGIIAGRSKLVAALKKDPFFRALRCDKLILSALEATVEMYLNGSAETSVPVLQMASATCDELRLRGEALVRKLSGAKVECSLGTGSTQMGGGALPRSSIASVTLDLVSSKGPLPNLAARLRLGQPPVIGYVENDRLRLDLRTVFPSEDNLLAEAIIKASKNETAGEQPVQAL